MKSENTWMCAVRRKALEIANIAIKLVSLDYFTPQFQLYVYTNFFNKKKSGKSTKADATTEYEPPQYSIPNFEKNQSFAMTTWNWLIYSAMDYANNSYENNPALVHCDYNEWSQPIVYPDNYPDELQDGLPILLPNGDINTPMDLIAFPGDKSMDP